HRADALMRHAALIERDVGALALREELLAPERHLVAIVRDERARRVGDARQFLLAVLAQARDLGVVARAHGLNREHYLPMHHVGEAFPHLRELRVADEPLHGVSSLSARSQASHSHWIGDTTTNSTSS